MGGVDTAQFDFGTAVVNPGDNLLNVDDEIVVTVKAIVTDVGANLNTVTISTSTTADFTSSSITSTQDLTIVDPLLAITLTQSVSTGDAGDLLTFTVTIA